MSRKDDERKWRSTFTRENREGERRLLFNLRNSGSAATGESLKRAQLSREEADFQSARRETHAIADYYEGPGNVDASIRPEGEIRAPAGVKTRTIYLNSSKIEQEFDGTGRLVSEVETPIGG